MEKSMISGIMQRVNLSSVMISYVEDR